MNQKIDIVRAYLEKWEADAAVIPTSDPHQNEYVADGYKLRAHLSGFTGSAGTLVVAKDWAGVWTDGRYELQASVELADSGIDLYCTANDDTPTIEQKLSELEEGAVVLVDGSRMGISEFKKIAEGIAPRTLQTTLDSNALWPDAPALSKASIYAVPDENAGASVSEKLSALREKLEKAGANATMIGASEDICWLLNLRGNDVLYTPVFYAFAWVDSDKAVLFVDEDKVDDGIREKLELDGVYTAPYQSAYTWSENTEPFTVLLDPNRTNAKIYTAIEGSYEIVSKRNPTTDLKAVKNEIEIENLKEAYRKDGIALTKFFRWLEEQGAGKTEWEVSERLREFRAEAESFLEPSFGTIAGYGPNAAIIHYAPSEAESAEVENKGLMLVDSGGQYEEGTTDITRTVKLGELTPEERKDYTLTLKSHIALANALFLKGATGTMLDGFARYPLWQHKMDYKHGTGHGVGYRLSVHEGPMSISRNWNEVPLATGMVVSIEPGIYRAGSHGVRIENITAVEPAGESEFGEFMRFKVLSYCYIDTAPIDLVLLTAEEKNWLNAYHKDVYALLSPGLGEEDAAFLKNKTRPVY